MTDGQTPAIEIEQLVAGYGGVPVLHGVDLSVKTGEFVAILGSSGCGKTTMLRTVAGFQKALGGAIRLFGKDVAALPPEKRGLAMVFQSYALWPHMSVLGNVGYGLRLRGMAREEIRKRVTAILAMLNLSGLEDRKVTDLSGGQRQRVALGRALAIDPSLLLLDEPLSNLDAKVRLQLRGEIKSLQRKLGFSALHVTHDREEAMTMADRIVVMEKGRIAQAGTPEEVWDRPVSAFVASFMGNENTIQLEAIGTTSASAIRAPDTGAAIALPRPVKPGPAIAYFRDDVARLDVPEAGRPDELMLPATIVARSYPGGHYRYTVAVGNRHYTVEDDAYREAGAAVGLYLPVGALHVFAAEHNNNAEGKPS